MVSITENSGNYVFKSFEDKILNEIGFTSFVSGNAISFLQLQLCRFLVSLQSKYLYNSNVKCQKSMLVREKKMKEWEGAKRLVLEIKAF